MVVSTDPVIFRSQTQDLKLFYFLVIYIPVRKSGTLEQVHNGSPTWRDQQ